MMSDLIVRLLNFNKKVLQRSSSDISDKSDKDEKEKQEDDISESYA